MPHRFTALLLHNIHMLFSASESYTEQVDSSYVPQLSMKYNILLGHASVLFKLLGQGSFCYPCQICHFVFVQDMKGQRRTEHGKRRHEPPAPTPMARRFARIERINTD